MLNVANAESQVTLAGVAVSVKNGTELLTLP